MRMGKSLLSKTTTCPTTWKISKNSRTLAISTGHITTHGSKVKLNLGKGRRLFSISTATHNADVTPSQTTQPSPSNIASLIGMATAIGITLLNRLSISRIAGLLSTLMAKRPRHARIVITTVAALLSWTIAAKLRAPTESKPAFMGIIADSAAARALALLSSAHKSATDHHSFKSHFLII